MVNEHSTMSVLGALILILFVGFGVWWWYSTAPETTTENQGSVATTTDEAAVRNLVAEFGTKLRLVSLMASTSAVIQAIEQNYAEYVSPELLSMWRKAPTSSPGRLTSSPSPDRIEIASVTRNANGSYTVRGGVVETTSADSSTTTGANSYPITLAVEQRNGMWVITEYERN